MSQRERSSRYDRRENAPFKFINIERPGAVVEQRTRRQVRSHVSRLQHRLHRERDSKTDNLKEYNATGAQMPTSAVHDAADSSPRELRRFAAGLGGSRAVSQTSNDSVNNRVTDLLQTRPNVLRNLCEVPTTPLEKAFSRGEIAFRTITLDDPENIVGSSISGLRLDISNLMSFYRVLVFTQAQDFDHQFGAVLPNVVFWERFYAFVFQDPIMINMALLLTARHQLETVGRSPQDQDLFLIGNLEQHIVRSINAALRDPSRRISDHLLVAVSLCASYDIKHGNPDSYGVHMKGLVQMIELRGGLPEVGKDPYVERLLLWQDSNTSELTGGLRYLDGMARSPGAEFPTPNTGLFRMK